MTRTALKFVFPALILLAALATGQIAMADTNAQIAEALINQNVYISPPLQRTSHVRPGDAARLKQVIDRASHQGAPEKIALVSHYPSQYATPSDAASNLQNYLGFSGVLVLVSPKGLGIGSDYLSPGDIRQVVAETQSLCRTSYTSCAKAAATRSIAFVNASQRSTHHSVLVFWVVTVAAFLVALVLLGAYTIFRKRSAPPGARRAPEPEPGESLVGSGS